MLNKKWGSLAIAGALSLGIIGVAAVPALAEDNPTIFGPRSGLGPCTQNLDEATQQKIHAIMDKAHTQLNELGITTPRRGIKGSPFPYLDDEKKEKATAIMDEAQAEIDKLGIEPPMKGHGRMGRMMN